MISQILRKLPIKLANVILARIILKTKLKNNPKYFKGVSVRSSNQIKLNLNPSDIGHQYLAFTGVYENELTKEILIIANKTNGLMVDVGANYGYYSILWANYNTTNSVVAFEASPKNFNAIHGNIKMNNLNKQIRFESFAICDQKGVLNFDMGPDEQTGWGGITKQTNDGNVTVDATTLDLYFENIIDLDIKILKIDTEGADFLVIKGAEKLLMQKKIKHIFWEENEYRANLLGIKPFESITFLKELGYAVKQIGNNEYHATI